MYPRFKHIKWLFDIKEMIICLIAIILSWIAEDWIRVNYGLHYGDWMLRVLGFVIFWILLVALSELFARIYKRIFQGRKA